MSAIFGIVNLGGRPVDPALFDRMALSLSHHGPDGTSVWMDGAVALGHQMLRVTPESHHETFPCSNKTGEVHLVATARIDNREDLCRTFHIPSAEQKTLPDSRLILKAYERWGEACPGRLAGDFSFAIWDGSQNRLVCATDHMSVHTLFYTWRPGQFVFASEIRGILALPDVPARINARRVASMVFPWSLLMDTEPTFFENVSMVPKATVMTVDAGGVRKRGYWNPAPAEGLDFKTDAAWFEAFREVWFQAVGARLRSDRPVVALLSGGLDSSSVVATAAHLLKKRGQGLTALSAVLPDGTSEDVRDERCFMDRFRTWDNIEIEYITDAWRGPFDEPDRLVQSAESPWCTSRHYLYTAFADAARRHDARVILEGSGGELGPSFYGQGYLAELLVRGRWLRLLREARQQAVLRHKRLSSVFIWEAIRPTIPLPMLRLLKRLARHDTQRTLGRLPLNHAFVQRHLGADMAALTGVAQATTATHPDHRKNQHRSIMLTTCSNLTAFVGFEHISWSFPYFDKRVLEFCLAVPGHLKVRDGWTRYLIRAGLDGILPPGIQWRTTTEPFSPDYHIRYNRQRPQVYEMLCAISRNDPIREVVDVEALKTMAQHDMVGNRDQTPENFAAMHLVPIGVYLIYFLRQFDDFRV